MLGKQAIIEFLTKNGIEYVFHLPGLHTLPLNERFEQQKNVRIITGRHESNVIFMADGYARVSDKPGVIMVTAGPGLGNIVSGCMEAFNSDVPLLVIHFDVQRQNVPKGVLHGVTAPENIFRHITKKTYTLSDIGELPLLLDNAYDESLSDRQGPVLVSIPYTFFEKEVSPGCSRQETEPQRTRAAAVKNEEKELDLFLDRFDKLVREKTRPLIIGGKSLMRRETAPVVDELCRTVSIPFLTTTGGKGILPENHPCAFGNIMRKGFTRNLIASSDIVIAIGTRLRDVDAKRRSVKIAELVHIDIDDRWIGKNYPARLSFTGNIARALQGIQSILKKRSFQWDLAELARSRQEEEAYLLKEHPAYAFTKLLRHAVPENATIVCDLNIPSYWSEYYLPVYHRNSFLMPRGISPIFYSLPASIGAKLGRPDRPCITLCGDGGLLPVIGELSSIRQYNVPVIVLIYNNSSFAILEDAMADRYSVHGSMNLTNPDFVKIAQAFGIKAKRTRTLNGLETIFRKDVTWDEPFLIEYIQPVSPPPWRI